MDISTPPLPSLFFSFSLYPPPPLLSSSLPDDYHVEVHAVPELGEREVLVKMLAVSISAGDAKCYMHLLYLQCGDYGCQEICNLHCCT